MEAGQFMSGTIVQIIVEEESRYIKITKLLAASKDYEYVAFEWMTLGSNS